MKRSKLNIFNMVLFMLYIILCLFGFATNNVTILYILAFVLIPIGFFLLWLDEHSTRKRK